MSKKRNKLRPDRSSVQYVYRAAEMDISNADAEQRSIPIVLATESPVPVYDVSRMEMVDEVIVMDGMDLPRQLPLVDSHNRDSVRNVLGSIRDLEISDSRLIGRAYFSSDENGRQAFQNYADGHLTDFSIGARRLEQEYEGKTRYVTRSQPVEGSAVIVGADPNATASVAVRAYFDSESLKGEAMADLRTRLIARGMPETIEGDAMLEWMDSQLETSPETEQEETIERQEELSEMSEEKQPQQVAETVDRAAIEQEIIQRHSEVREVCRAANVSADQTDAYVASGKTADEVAGDILRNGKSKSEPVGNTPVAVVADSSDRFFAAANCGLVRRSLQQHGKSAHQIVETAKSRSDHAAVERWSDLGRTYYEQPAEGWNELQYCSLSDLARKSLEVRGERGLDRLPKQEIVRRAFSQRSDMIERAAEHSTGTFSNLLLDASNKTLLAAYDEAPATYTQWTRQVSVPDFKTINRIRLGELADPEVVPENHEYPEKNVGDNRETYNVEKYGAIFSITLEAVVNDDLDAITRIPAMHGNAMRRKVNKVAYAVLTDNGTLSDGIALFHATSHGANLDATALAAGAPLNVGFNVMMTQSGLNTGTTLGIMPRYLIVPANLSATALQITNGMIQPATSATVNLYGQEGPRTLMTIVDAQLDSSSTTGWYLAADPAQVDTVEVAFLQGEESPILTREEEFNTDAVKFKCRQSFAAAAIDYRGLYQGNS